MTRETVIENAYITLWYHPDTKIVHHEIHMYVYGDTLRDALMRGTELLQEHGASKWLSNDRSNAALHQDDIAWLTDNFAPKAMEVGWRYWAVIAPQSVVGRMSIESTRKFFSELGLIVEVFDDEPSAMAWLTEQG